MRAASVTILVLAYALQTAGALAASHQNLINQRVVVDGVSAVVDVRPANDYPHEGYYVTAAFHAENGTSVQLGCMSVTHDFRYELRNSSGGIVPINQEAVDGSDLPPGWSAAPGTYPCATSKPLRGTVVKYIPLAAFYPRVPPGTYTLRLTFAPRGLSQQVALPPITITVDKDHPL